MASAAAQKSVVATAPMGGPLGGWRGQATAGASNEIFIDLVDRISALITAEGQVRAALEARVRARGRFPAHPSVPCPCRQF